jgi:hypothetical protein
MAAGLPLDDARRAHNVPLPLTKERQCAAPDCSSSHEIIAASNTGDQPFVYF